MRNRVLTAFILAASAMYPTTQPLAGDGGWIIRGPVQRASKLAPNQVPVYHLHSQSLVREPRAPKHSVGLRGSMQHALDQDAEWMAALKQIEVSDFEMRREASRYVPTLTASYSTQNSLYGSNGFSGRDRDTFVALSASMPLYSGGSIFYGYKAANARKDEAIFNSLAVRDQRLIRLLEVWTQAIVGERELVLAKGSIHRLTQLRQAIAAQVSVGFASPSDLAQVDADISAAQRSVSTINADLTKARAELTRSGSSSPVSGAQFANFDAFLYGGKAQLVKSAYSNNPQLQGAAAAYRAESYDARAALGRHLPQVNLTGSYREYYEASSSTTTNTDDRIQVGLEVSIPLIDFSTVYDTRAIAARRDVALYNEAATLHSVKLQIDSLWEDYNAAKQMRTDATNEVTARRKNAEAAQKRYELGFGLLDEAIRAESSLLSAQRELLQMKSQQSLTAARLLVVSGRFDISMLSR